MINKGEALVAVSSAAKLGLANTMNYPRSPSKLQKVKNNLEIIVIYFVIVFGIFYPQLFVKYSQVNVKYCTWAASTEQQMPQIVNYRLLCAES